MIRRLRRLGAAFLRASNTKRLLAIEALTWLIYARVVTLLPAKIYTRNLGDTAGSDQAPGPEAVEKARVIGAVVARVARLMPFRAVCLQQVIAVRRMLRRRGIPAIVNLGLSRGAEAVPDGDGGRQAHAWVVSGSTIVNGDHELEKFTIVGRFY
ncbi:MAG: lasso peptide biosynthesis B2 protein [Pseudomonadota bacterium]